MPKEEDAEELAFRERVRDAIQSGGKSGKMSEKTGIPVGTLNKYVSLRSSPSVLNATKIAHAVGLTVEQLATRQTQSQGSLTRQQTQAVADIVSRRDDFVGVPLYNVQAAAGNGIVPVDEQEPREEIILTRTFLRRLGAQAESCHIIFAKGESMQPTIPDGSLLLIDLSKSQIVDNGVFVFRVGDDIKVKRARWRVDQRIDLVSDNQLAGYPPETYTLDEVTDIQPIGRVMCIMRVP